VKADVANGMLPHLLNPREPIWHCLGVSEASYLLVICRGDQGSHVLLGLFSPAAGYARVVSLSHGRCRMGLPSSLILFSLFSSLRLSTFVGSKVSRRSP
jgi:hypothetical protein